jgi:hypothetical protein
MLLMSIGPGALFLYRASMRRIGAARRAGGAQKGNDLAVNPHQLRLLTSG